MQQRKMFLILREMIREIAEDGFDRDDLTAFVDEAICLSYEEPSEAIRRSERDLDEFDSL